MDSCGYGGGGIECVLARCRCLDAVCWYIIESLSVYGLWVVRSYWRHNTAQHGGRALMIRLWMHQRRVTVCRIMCRARGHRYDLPCRHAVISRCTMALVVNGRLRAVPADAMQLRWTHIVSSPPAAAEIFSASFRCCWCRCQSTFNEHVSPERRSSCWTFYPRDALHSAACRRAVSVCLSVCLSVTRQYCV